MESTIKKHIGSYDKSVKGKKAVLTQEITFRDNFDRNERSLKIFPAGTIIIAAHEVYGTGLTTFQFKTDNGRTYEHVVREGKFNYID